jgi:hypothetical protein
MPNPMYKHPMPTEVLKDQIADLKQQLADANATLDECTRQGYRPHNAFQLWWAERHRNDRKD